jgi:predicted nucleotidyltransferase
MRDVLKKYQSFEQLYVSSCVDIKVIYLAVSAFSTFLFFCKNKVMKVLYTSKTLSKWQLIKRKQSTGVSNITLKECQNQPFSHDELF